VSYIDYHVATVMADRTREAQAARRPHVRRQRSRWIRGWPSRGARLRVRPV